MNELFRAYVSAGRDLATSRGLEWDLVVGDDGRVPNELAWNLTRVVNSPGTTYRLNDFGSDLRTLSVLNGRFEEQRQPTVSRQRLSAGWQDLIKACTVDQLLSRRNTPLHVSLQVIRPIRVLATCVQANSGAEPWAMTSDDARFACDIASQVQQSGKLGELVRSIIKSVLDVKRLCDFGPFHHLLVPGKKEGRQERGPQMLSLSDRKRAERLPEGKAFWELVRIVLTERPRTFLDKIRFAQIRLLLFEGLRVGEVCRFPLDWRRTVEHTLPNGGNPSGVGGVDRTLRYRYFAEKQQGRSANSVELVEAVRDVSPLFEEIMVDTLRGVENLTSPLRERLRQQCETGRFLPELPEDALLDLGEVYVRLTGNPTIRDRIPEDLLRAYQDKLNHDVLSQIAARQEASPNRFRTAVYQFWWRAAENGGPPRRYSRGENATRESEKLRVRVADVEDYIRSKLITKHPDTMPLPLRGGRLLMPYEMLFLAPKRPLSESRNGGICDVTRYFSVGLVTPQDLMDQLAGGEDGIFARYGESEEDRCLSLNTHSLRHLLTSELLREGLADTILTKRFNRRSVAETYAYDHRTLHELLEAQELPPAARALPEKVRLLAALIQTGKAHGPVIETFKRIQQDKGDDEAFQFLAAEADGFHATPYGFCVNSFIVDPCPKHLQCFDGCRHLVACLLDRQRANLEKVRERTARGLEDARQRSGSTGRDNQIKHAENLIANIDKLLATSDGEAPFKDGRDLSDLLGHNNGPLLDGIVGFS